MLSLIKYLKVILGFIFLIFVTFGIVNYYPFLFSRHVEGIIDSVERVDLNISLLQTSETKMNPQLFSFAVAIKEKSGEIVTASAEDRQWMAATPGRCVEAKFYPYPPWALDKAGTYFGARLLRMWECEKK
ncbi:MAG TPA: hypothetical protein PLJ21_00445 [Pseudobdellovibrionaceae bacterium]|nr:hypothetical protein [Pseudobdellovibrionaceae bacterium]